MIDCLSNPSWINPQIDCLIFLQNFRIGHLEFLDKFFLSITIFGEFWLPSVICALVYWCIDFRAGVYLLGLESINIFLTHFLKMVACVYRPWVLNNNLHPSELAIPYAKGYSCPSGHTAMSSSVVGGVAYLIRKHKLLCALLICLILLIGFSRLWLGVHTPQDVLFGLSIGLVLIFGVNALINWAEKNTNRYLYLLGIINVFAILALIYMCYFNSYRIDYINGELLVNPLKSIYVTCVIYGYSFGLINGCFLCRRFFPFNPKETSVKVRIIRGIIGATGLILMLKFAFQYMIMNVSPIRIVMPISFIIGIIITLGYPLLFTKIENLLLKK